MPPPAIAGIWDRTLLPFLIRHSVLLAVCFVAAASVRIAATYNQLSLTFDEPAHLACGMEYVAHHVYRYESQHPPLSRAMIALVPYLDGVRPHGLAIHTFEGVDEVRASRDPDRTVILARAGNLPFFWIACLVVFVWTQRYFGAAEAVAATAVRR